MHTDIRVERAKTWNMLGSEYFLNACSDFENIVVLFPLLLN